MSNILIVDDFTTQRNIIRIVVEKTGAKIFEARDGKEALEMHNTVDMDLIITDYEMPNMNGIELAESIRSSGNNEEVPIIMITSNFDSRQKAIAAGVTHWISKPYDSEVLLKNIKKYAPGIKSIEYDVLLIDDVQVQTKIWERTLKMENFNYHHANSAREGMKILREENIDFIITDYLMPDVDGLRFIKKVKSMPQFKDIPIIIISEDERIHDVVGPDKVICTFRKPFNPAHVKDAIKSTIE